MNQTNLPHPDLVRHRLGSQRLADNPLGTAAEIVGWLGGVQSQDYAGAKWAIIQRSPGLTDRDIDDAYNRGDILRTHVLRPTWHCVTPNDIRWLLDLTAPAIRASMKSPMRQHGLEPDMVVPLQSIIVRALEGGHALTREELFERFGSHGKALSHQAVADVMALTEIDQLICSGPMKGTKHTYALLDERAPDALRLTREEALAQLAVRYFQSHGPCTEYDLSWWSMLPVTECRRAIALAGDALHAFERDGRTWYQGANPVSLPEHPHIRLLPNYDEYFSRDGLRTRYPGPPSPQLERMLSTRFAGHHLMVDGLIYGSWKRTIGRTEVRIRVEEFLPLGHEWNLIMGEQGQRMATSLGREAIVHSSWRSDAT